MGRSHAQGSNSHTRRSVGAQSRTGTQLLRVKLTGEAATPDRSGVMIDVGWVELGSDGPCGAEGAPAKQ
jgi:hypothetical protein